MQAKIIFLLFLTCAFYLARSEEWFETGHRSPLTWENFDSTINQPTKYKFVKFFTRNCRYCRFLKQVEEQLRKQKQWNFQFYDVDCSIHYDLCTAKAAISAFPYVAIYNTKGEQAGKIGGYYPLQSMREAFNTIESWQADDLKSIEPVSTLNQISASQAQHSVPTDQHHQSNASPTSNDDVKHQQVKIENADKYKQNSPDEDSQGWASSIKDGIKMICLLLGVLMFNKIISPYLQQQKQSQEYSKTHIIELPVKAGSSMLAKPQLEYQTNQLLADSL